jgi:hypothetical protein
MSQIGHTLLVSHLRSTGQRDNPYRMNSFSLGLHRLKIS